MNKSIRSYDDLIKEKERLEILFQAQKQVIFYDIEEIKAELAPVKDTIAVIKKLFTKDRTNLLLSLGSDIAVTALVQKFILQKAGWVLRMIVPFFAKNYASHFVAEKKDKWLDKLKTWLGHLNGKEHKKDDTYADER